MQLSTLILTCNTGAGHNSAAAAAAGYYAMQGEKCDICDALSFVSHNFSDLISKGHVAIYRHCNWLFDAAWNYSEGHPAAFAEGSFSYERFAKGGDALFEYIEKSGCDSVISTHVFASLMLTDMLKKHPMKLTTGFISTDFTCAPGTKNCKADLFFIPAEELIPDFKGPEIPREKIVVSGIPVRQAFYKSVPKDAAKRKYGIDPSHKHIIMCSGSMGCGPMKELTDLLAEKLPNNIDFSAAFGTNKALFDKMKARYKGKRNMHFYGVLDDMSEFMDSADLYLTKPGGISISEAMVKNLPLVFIDAVAGCEKYNRTYFMNKGYAAGADNAEELAELCVRLISGNAMLARLKENLLAKPHINSSEIIYMAMKKKQKEKSDGKQY